MLHACSTSNKIQGRYTSLQRDTIIIGKTGTLISATKSRDNNMIVKQRGNLLKFKTTWYNNRILTPSHKLHFKILSDQLLGLTLSPVTRWSKIMFPERDSVVLIRDTSYRE